MRSLTLWLIIKWLLIGAALYYLPLLIPSITVATYGSALIFALVLTLLNYTVRPILFVLTLPINIVTLGLFSFILNTVIFALAAYFITGITVDGFIGALLGAICLSIASYIIDVVFRPSNKG